MLSSGRRRIFYARATAKAAVRRGLRSVGYEITRTAAPFHDLQARLLASCDLVVDVGANTGQYVERIRALGYSGRIVSFEPQSAAFAVLHGRAAKATGWDVRRVALGAGAGMATLLVSRNSVSSSLLDMRSEHLRAAPDSAVVSREDVALSTLDGELDGHPARAMWLKLDVQGVELPVLRGGQQVLPLVSVIQAELSLRPLYEADTDYLELCDFLRDHGFVLAHVSPGFADPASGELLQLDGLFVRAGSRA